MIGIIGAMDVEVESLLALLDGKEMRIVSGIKFTKGKLYGKDVVIAKCGCGKVNSALCCEAMILTYHPDLIINTGVSGSLTEKLGVCDIAIADDVCQHDFDTSPIGDPYGMISDINLIKIPADKKARNLLAEITEETGINYMTGTIASGDIFVSKAETKKAITSYFGAISCEMEGGSIGHVCYLNETPFAVLRAISDNANDDSPMDFPTFVKKAAEQSIEILCKFIQRV